MPTSKDFTEAMARVNRGLLIGDEMMGGLNVLEGLVSGRHRFGRDKPGNVVANNLQMLKDAYAAEMRGQRALEDDFAARRPNASALVDGATMAASMLLPAGAMNAGVRGGSAALKALRGVTGAAAGGYGYGALDRGDLDERLTAANEEAAINAALTALPFSVPLARHVRKSMAGPRPAPRLTTTFEVQTGANTGQPMAPDMRVGRLDPIGPGGRREDALYRAAGYKSQGPVRRGTGAYNNSLGEMEHNPVFIGDIELRGGLRDPQTKANVESLEGLRALLTAQEAGAAHSIGEEGVENAILMQRARLPRGPEMAGLSDMGDLPYMATPSSRGALAFPYDMGDTSRLDDVADKLAQEMNLPGSQQRRVVADSVYVPGLAKGFDDDYNLVASEPFSGEATVGALQRLAGADDQMTANLAGDRRLRGIIGDMVARDEKVPGARQDLQNTRKLFMDPRFNEALQLIRLGAPPAAALAAIGYSTSSLADEGE